MLRKPIVCVLGHVDHGKTTLLDAIRNTKVQAKEAGQITQDISAWEVPISVINSLCKPLMEKMKTNFTIPGLLFIDTPGHEAFVNLRRRGGSIADIAILVIDANQGMQNQTKEALEILKEYKTPFVVAATKMDAVSGWKSQKDSPFSESFAKQRREAQDELDKKIYELVGQLSSNNISSERFDRVESLTKQVCIVPVSAKQREGIPELLMFVAGLAQRFLEKRLDAKEESMAKGSILEVTEEKGIGKALNTIIYEGKLKEGERIAFLSAEGKIIKSRAKALIEPKGICIKEVVAAAGVKIACDDAELAVAGSSLFAIDEKNEKEIEELLAKDAKDIEISTEENGAIVKADALGSLEAIVKLFGNAKIAIRSAGIGKVLKKDVMEAKSVEKENKFAGVIFAFNTEVDEEARKKAEEEKVKVFEDKVIYNLIDNYKSWVEETKNSERKEAFANLTTPAKMYVMEKHCFRMNGPCIFGIEMLAGRLKKGSKIMNGNGIILGELKDVQHEGKSVEEAKRGQQVAVSVSGPTFGRQIKEKQILYSSPEKEEMETLEKKYKSSLSDEDKELLAEIKKIKGSGIGFSVA